MAELTLGSLFDGLGGWQLAALHNGVRPVWSSEIEAFPMAITEKHFPDTLQLGDITKLDGRTLPLVDIICAGSPCQGLSINGKGKGLNDERSGLFRKAIDIVRGMRTATNGEYPKIFIWENVPGAFSSNKGADFQAVLEEITKSKIPMPAGGKWAAAGMVRSRRCDIAWRVLDAQYWGVPQRRKRIFLVADFRNQQSRNTEVLFEPESVPRNPTPGGKEGQGAATGVENNTGITSSFEPGITARDGRKLSHEVSTTLRANMGDNQTSILTCKSVYSIQGNTIDRQLKNGANGKGVSKDISYTLNTVDCHAVTDKEQYAVDFGRTADRIQMEATKSTTLSAQGGGMGTKTGLYCLPKGDDVEYIVRRLTPLECERLQGLPDNFTDVKCNGKPASDSARYKAIGNGMAQPCADFVLSKVVQVLRC